MKCPLCDHKMRYWEHSRAYGYMCLRDKCGYDIIESKEDA